jgi:general secretion pathway protein M
MMNTPVWFSTFWQQRNASERRTLTLAATALVALLGYQFIWSPVQRADANAHNRLVQAEQLAAFTAQAKTTLMKARPKSAQPHFVSPMLWVEQAARSVGIEQQLIQRQPDGEDRVQLKFAAVPFDLLLRWMAQASDAGLDVQSASITPKSGDSTGVAGLVDAQITLAKRASAS